jgi:1-deoxy-D-xylulose-5-phosphate reductoisomerase
MKNLTVLGSTGSIGCNTLAVAANQDSAFRIFGLAAGRNVTLLAEQAERFRPEILALEREEDAEAFRRASSFSPSKILFGPEGIAEVAGDTRNDIVVSAITGINGLRPTLAAVESGARVALANKESLVVGGFLLREAASRSGAEIIPVDSEHSAVFQCLGKERAQDVRKVILTASGGPFFRLTPEEMRSKPPEEALNHPRWKMGKKVTIDSATMMNKGLELIEARWLFDLTRDQLGILIHPQSIVHSLVEMCDGSVLAQLSLTDMKIPIQYALTFPERADSGLPSLDLSRIKELEFYDVDLDQFPLVSLALEALEREQAFSVSLNAANELAVEAYIEKQIEFFQIHEVVAESLASQEQNQNVLTLDDIFAVDREARERTRQLLQQRN